MTTLKEAIETVHKEAEQTPWSQLLVSGNITEKQWMHYLQNMYTIFESLEQRGLIENTSVLRSEIIKKELNSTAAITANQTKLYTEYLRKLSDKDLLAHVYAHYLAFLYGGRYISKVLKWPTKVFHFDKPEECIDNIRKITKDVDHNEAINAFNWTIRVYNNLWHDYG